MTTFAYARVSAKDQNLDRQIDALTAYGIAPENIFSDKKSGKDFNRESYIALKNTLQAGDLLVIKSLDRLGRNYDGIIDEWTDITKRMRVDIYVIDMPLLDTRTNNNLTGRLVSDVVLQVLSFVAQSERENIKERQKEGIDSAKRRGVRFGRPLAEEPDDFDELIGDYQNGFINMEELLRRTGLKKSTLYNRMRARLHRPPHDGGDGDFPFLA